MSGVDDGVPLLEWHDELLRGGGVLKRWQGELEQALQKAQEEPTALLEVGRAAVIETDNWLAAACAAKRIAADLKLPFVAISRENLAEVLLGLVPLRMPMVVFLCSDDTWSRPEFDGQDNSEDYQRLRATADLAQVLAVPAARAQLIRGVLLFESLPHLILVTQTPNLSRFSHALSGANLFDRRFGLPPVSAAQIGRQLLNDLGLEYCSSTLQAQAAKLVVFLNEDSPIKRQSDLHQLRRLQRRLGRPLEFSDIVSAGHAHFIERDAEPDLNPAELARRKLVAYHEAGHAAMQMIHSKGQHMPEHATISGSGDVGGFVIMNLEQRMQGLNDFRQFQGLIRVGLAGRAAEELLLGAEGVSAGAQSDLRSATGLSMHCFAHYGYAPNMLDSGGSGSNLVVWNLDQASQFERVHDMVRQWLATEYAAVKQLLAQHRALLDAIAQALLVDPVQDQEELTALWLAHGGRGVESV